MPEAAIVIPCYNEAKRFQAERLRDLVAADRMSLIFVDDGSTDETGAVLKGFIASFPAATAPVLLSLPANKGKAEAVRLGMQTACRNGFPLIGYYDADLAAPPEELVRLLDTAATGSQSVVMGSRVQLLGYDIQRSATRHYLGRVFASTASFLLGIPVYDTQCGAKLFRRSPLLEHALAQPFSSRWCFDVELIGRLLVPLEPGVPGLSRNDFLEVPLKTWHGIAGSHVKARSMLAATVELILIGISLNRRRARLRGQR